MVSESPTSSPPQKPLRVGSPAKRVPVEAAQPVVEKITVFVATCQIAQFDNQDQSQSTGTNAVFKQMKFQTLARPNATLEDLRYFLLSQWVITKCPYTQLPPEQQFYTYKGRILRLDGTLDGYYISHNDTIYLRFTSLGKICDPWAMSTSELRSELKARDAYVPKLQPEQLMMRLVEQMMRESRMHRLQLATKREQSTRVEEITRELAQFQDPNSNKTTPKRSMYTTTNERQVSPRVEAGAMAFPRPMSLQWPHAPCANRTVFLSIAQLERTYQVIPRDVLDPAILLFDTERKWVFDKHNALQKASFDYRYMCFDSDFLEFLTLKEEMGLVFWFRPHTNYDKLSTFLCSIDDPVSQKKYEPLLLKENKWLTLCGINGWEGKLRNDGRKKDTTKFPKFTKSISRITTNLQSQSFDYIAVQEILYQTNPTLLFAPM